MGRDKALVPIAGKSLMEHMLEKLRAAGFAPRIAGGDPALGAFAERIPDRRLGCGPLSGIEAALASTQSEVAVFVAVDLALLPPQLPAYLIDRAGRSGAPATIPAVEGRPQPLCAAYRRELLPGITASLDRGERKVMRGIGTAAEGCGASLLDVFSLEDVRAADPWGMLWLPPVAARAMLNCNTPQELQKAATYLARPPASVHCAAALRSPAGVARIQ